MLNDMKLSTILLLAVAVFLIYYLTKPTEKFTNQEAKQEATQELQMISGNEVGPSIVNTEAEIPAELVSEVLAEAEGKMAVAGNNVARSGGSSFQGNDEQVSAGASLDAAFEKPVPESTKTDEVDLNRNNVKNYNAKDYLPKEVNDDWFNTDFSQAKYKMNDDKLINTEKYVIGINTVGQSLKNASYDIRGSINVPKYSVSPWNNSTTEPDYNIKPLC